MKKMKRAIALAVSCVMLLGTTIVASAYNLNFVDDTASRSLTGYGSLYGYISLTDHSSTYEISYKTQIEQNPDGAVLETSYRITDVNGTTMFQGSTADHPAYNDTNLVSESIRTLDRTLIPSRPDIIYGTHTVKGGRIYVAQSVYTIAVF
ncbi:MAG: hypothetical protein LBV33_04345 [Lachnospiraceae bacterium]|nr:hypothetical protein [Lachnospiraceae bacterium]